MPDHYNAKGRLLLSLVIMRAGTQGRVSGQEILENPISLIRVPEHVAIRTVKELRRREKRGYWDSDEEEPGSKVTQHIRSE